MGNLVVIFLSISFPFQIASKIKPTEGSAPSLKRPFYDDQEGILSTRLVH